MCLRRERQKRLEKAFDGNFDPDHTSTVVGSTYHDKPGRKATAAGTLPDVGVNVDNEDDGMGGRLAGAAIGAGVISPYVLGQNRQPHPSYSPQHHLQQYYEGGNRNAGSPYGGTTSESGTYISPSSTGSYYPSQHMQHSLPNPHDYPPALIPGAMLGMTPPSPTTSTPPSVTSARTAKEREARVGGAFAVANPDVLVHQDAGRVPEEDREQDETEIPPTYDSIPKT